VRECAFMCDSETRELEVEVPLELELRMDARELSRECAAVESVEDMDGRRVS
jgi:hypothetical protein